MVTPDRSIMQIQKLTMLLKYQEEKKNMYLAGYDEEKILKEAIKEGIEQSRLENIKNVLKALITLLSRPWICWIFLLMNEIIS